MTKNWLPDEGGGGAFIRGLGSRSGLQWGDAPQFGGRVPRAGGLWESQLLGWRWGMPGCRQPAVLVGSPLMAVCLSSPLTLSRTGVSEKPPLACLGVLGIILAPNLESQLSWLPGRRLGPGTREDVIYGRGKQSRGKSARGDINEQALPLQALLPSLNGDGLLSESQPFSGGWSLPM